MIKHIYAATYSAIALFVLWVGGVDIERGITPAWSLIVAISIYGATVTYPGFRK